jgi:predicted Zn-dependent protease
MVRRVLNRLIPVSGIQDSKWETYVIDDPDTANAFVLPGYVYWSTDQQPSY